MTIGPVGLKSMVSLALTTDGTFTGVFAPKAEQGPIMIASDNFDS